MGNEKNKKIGLVNTKFILQVDPTVELDRPYRVSPPNCQAILSALTTAKHIVNNSDILNIEVPEGVKTTITLEDWDRQLTSLMNKFKNCDPNDEVVLTMECDITTIISALELIIECWSTVLIRDYPEKANDSQYVEFYHIVKNYIGFDNFLRQMINIEKTHLTNINLPEYSFSNENT